VARIGGLYAYKLAQAGSKFLSRGSSRFLHGSNATKGELSRGITVTSPIFNFSTRFFAQIVENRETQLSSPFLGPGDNFFEKL
jgi:hypothetical protein